MYGGNGVDSGLEWAHSVMFHNLKASRLLRGEICVGIDDRSDSDKLDN